MEPDLLARLRSAREVQSKDWLVMEQSLGRMDALTQRAIWAAAVPHWFDLNFLCALLVESPDHLTDAFASLTHLSFVEVYPDLGFNIHESSRKLLIDQLWRTYPTTFVEFSRRARDYCSSQDQEAPAWRIEFLYHYLAVDPQEAMRLLATQADRWKQEHRDDKVEMLVRSALEAAEGGRLPGSIKDKIELMNAGLGLVYGQKEIKRLDDHQIVAGFLAGDAEAVRSIDGWIIRAAWPYQRRLADEWDEVLQQIRLEVSRLLGQGKFRGESSLRTYLWRIVSHTCHDILRARSKWKWADLEALEDPDSVVRRYINQETDDLKDMAARAEERDLLLRSLARVPKDCRQLWRMIVEGLSYREIGARLNMNEGVIRVRILRCRERALALRSELFLGQEGAGTPHSRAEPKGAESEESREPKKTGH